MKLAISLRRVIVFFLAAMIGYSAFVLSLGNEGAELVNSDISNNVLLRKNFLVRILSQKSSPQHFFLAGESQYAGEWTLVSFSMAAAGLTNIAMKRPGTAHESSQVIANLIQAVLKEDMAYFDTVAWGEFALNDKVLNDDRGHVGYYGHLNFMLGCYALLNNDGRFKETHLKVSEAIARRMKKYQHRHIETYPGETYPPDNTVSAASLSIADMTLGTNYAVLLQEWVEASKKLEDPLTGLIAFQMNLDGGQRLQISRGSHIGWNSFFYRLLTKNMPLFNMKDLKKLC